MNRIRVAHLLDDLSVGGVTRNLRTFDHPVLAAIADSRTLRVAPSWSLAPTIDADVIMTHFPPAWRFLPFLASLGWRNPRARLIHVEHSYTGCWEALKVTRPGRFRALLRLGYRQFHRIVAVSSAQAAWLSSIGAVEPERLDVISSWSDNAALIDLPAVKFDASSIHRAGGRPLVIGSCGRYCEQKGFDVLIAAMKLLDPAHFVLELGGFGPDEARLRTAAAGHGHIRVGGAVDDLAGFMGRCDVFVVPSRWEAFGLVAAEAKLAGRPLIVADVDGLPEQVGAAGVVADARTPRSLAAAIATAIDLPLGAMGAAGRADAMAAQHDRLQRWRQLLLA